MRFPANLTGPSLKLWIRFQRLVKPSLIYKSLISLAEKYFGRRCDRDHQLLSLALA
jgi:hypothetical protein